MTTPAAPTNQTRQQLEELDALLQRMLSLPLSPAEAGEEPKPLPASAKVPIPLPPAPPVLLVKEMPPASPPVPGQPNVQAWRVEMPTPNPNPPPAQEPAINTWSAPVKAPVQSPPTPTQGSSVVYGSDNPATAPVVVETKSVAPPAAPPKKQSAPPLPVWVWPFYLLNLLFDLSTYTLGPFTRWLSYPATKHALGWLGVMMMILSFGFAVSLVLGFDWGSEIVK
jgi:hypothetical protein